MRAFAAACLAMLPSLLLSPCPVTGQSPERAIYAFSNCGDTVAPLIADAQGNLYGAAQGGGAADDGCIFELSPSSDGWQESTIYSFSGADGNGPSAALQFDGTGNLYGTTIGGGAFNYGVAFELTPTADGVWTEAVLHSFGGDPDDGAGPECNLAFDEKGNIYGTTGGGGPHNTGTVFRLGPSKGGWTETTLYAFQSGISGPNGAFPEGGLVIDSRGHLYGVTQTGGESGSGAVFELAPDADGYKEKIILSLDGFDGAQPTSGLAMDENGNLYGTTAFFGGKDGDGSGTIFRLTKNSRGGWTERTLLVLHGPDGYMAQGPPAFDDAGHLYATAESGGLNGMGTVLMLTPTETGEWTENVLHRFDFKFPDGEDGENPYAGVIFAGGHIFGTTPMGGVNDDGVVFEIAPAAAGSAAPEP